MNPTRWAVLEPILERALDTDPNELDELLMEACGGDHVLRDTIERMLAAQGKARFPKPSRLLAMDESRFPQIDRFELVRRIGQGGMGEVFEARRLEPIRDRVALKVLRPGFSTEMFLARFQLEKEALEALEHPNVARILDSGTTSDGRPFIATELVDGLPLLDYCDEKRLPVIDRLHLFEDLCRGVEHANNNEIVHRDLKPSNVLVGIVEGAPIVKVVDFGIAKLLGAKSRPNDLTEHGQVMGTLPFMSPEHLRPDEHRVDTRTDVYGLGNILYSLVAGLHPVDLDAAGHDREALRRAILEEDPARPSRRLAGLPDGGAQIAASRATDSRDLVRQLGGELDWIVSRTLRKRPGERYQSARELRNDIRRYLDGEPVQAHPPSRWYTSSKLLRKHSAAVFGVAATFLILLASTLVLSFFLRETRQARDRAEREAVQTTQVKDFLVGLFEGADPWSMPEALTLSAKDLLDLGAAKLDKELGDQPLLLSDLLSTLGEVYGGLGLLGKSAQLHERALTLRQQHLEPDHPDIAETLNNLGWLRYRAEQYDEAEVLYREALEIKEAALGNDDPKTLTTLSNLGMLLRAVNRYEEAEETLQLVLRLRREQLGENHLDVARSLNNLGLLYAQMERRSDADSLYREALRIERDLLPPDHPTIATRLINIGLVLAAQNRNSEAETMIREALAIREGALGPHHQLVAENLLTVASMVARDTERFEEAEDLYERALQALEASHGRSSRQVAILYNNVAALNLRTKNLEGAAAAFGKAIDVARSLSTPDEVMTGRFSVNLAVVRLKQGLLDEAVAAAREAASLLRGGLPADDPWITWSEFSLGRCYLRLGRLKEAEGLMVASFDSLLEKGWFRPDEVSELAGELVELHERLGVSEEAGRYLQLLNNVPAGSP